MDTAIKQPVPDRVKTSFWHRPLWRSAWASECPNVKYYKWGWLNPIWHRMLYSCIHVATVGVKALTDKFSMQVCVCLRSSVSDTAARSTLRHTHSPGTALQSCLVRRLLIACDV